MAAVFPRRLDKYVGLAFIGGLMIGVNTPLRNPFGWPFGHYDEYTAYSFLNALICLEVFVALAASIRFIEDHVWKSARGKVLGGCLLYTIAFTGANLIFLSVNAWPHLLGGYGWPKLFLHDRVDAFRYPQLEFSPADLMENVLLYISTLLLGIHLAGRYFLKVPTASAHNPNAQEKNSA